MGKALPEPGITRGRLPATARAAGKAAERAVVTFARANGSPHAERRLAGSRVDRGDVAGMPGVVLEVKSPGPNAPLSLATWLTETLTEAANDDASIGLLVIRRRGCTDAGDWYWLTNGHTMARLLRESGWWSRHE